MIPLYSPQVEQPRMRRYYVQRKLLGGEPDTNRRVIIRSADDTEVWRRDPGPQGWSAEDETALRNALAQFSGS